LLLAGFALGAAMSVKIWWLASVAVVVLWYVGHARTRRQAGPLTLGVAAALLVLDLPFFVLAPAAMWRMVVLDQLGRNPNRTSLIARLRLLTSLRETLPHLTGPRLVAVLGVLGAGAILLGIAAWRHAACRMLVVVAAVQMAVLMLAPSYFPFYSDYVATGISFVVAGAAATAHPPGRLRGSRFAARLGPAGAVAAVAVAAAICVGMVFYRPIRSITPFPSEAMADDAAHLHCVMSDSPMALIALDDLSRDLADRCQNWVDVTGRTYGIDAPPADHLVSRVHNEKWQRDLRRYLLSGNAVILVRGDTGVGPGIKDTIRRLPVLVDSGGHVLRLVTADRDGSRVTRRSA
jgi:hypothetical protein